MRLNFYTIPIAHPESAQAELNQFLATHRVSRVEKVFVPDGAASAWCAVVTWPAGAARWQLDQQRQELPVREPQRERAG